MVVVTDYLIINITLFVIIAYLSIQCYRDIKEILKDDNDDTFKD